MPRGSNRCTECGKFCRAFARTEHEYSFVHNICFRCEYPDGLRSMVAEWERSAAEDDHSHDCDPLPDDDEPSIWEGSYL